MNSAAPKPAGWSVIRARLATLDKSALLALLKELHAAADVNRDLLRARCLSAPAGAPDPALLEKYRRCIVDQFFPDRGFGKLKLGEARQAVRDYRKDTVDEAGARDLLLTYIEQGTAFTCEYGDITESFYNSLESAAAELQRLLQCAGAPAYAPLQERIQKVAASACNIGWGFGDFRRGWADELEIAFGPEAGSSFR